MRNKKSIIIIAICIGVLFMGIGYSVFSSSLVINGTANITTKWEIYISGVTKTASTGGAYNIEEPSFDHNVVKFNIGLINPGDSMTYTVTIKNAGTINAKLSNYNVSQSGSDSIVYTVSGLTKGMILNASKTVSFTVKASYNSTVEYDPTARFRKINIDLDWEQYSASSDPGNIELPGIEEVQTYQINYDLNGGQGNITHTNCIVGDNCQLANEIPTKNGYTFVGWKIPNSNFQYSASEEVYNLTGANQKITLQAIWGIKQDFNVFGNFTYKVPDSGYYQLELWGAEGGYRTNVNGSSNYSGRGGYVKGTVYLEKDTYLYVNVGGSGNTGGFNGGGISGCSNASACGQSVLFGGGASDIRVGGSSLNHRLIVAGGGGSVGAPTIRGGAGGGTDGEASGSGNVGEGCSTIACGMGGTQTSGGKGSTSANYLASQGTFGQGGEGYYLNNGYGGGGGGGWYGGSGSVPDASGDNDRGGGGGSSYILTESSIKPSGYLLDSKYYMTNTVMLSGNTSMPNPNGGMMIGKTGNGFIRIIKL